jgi:hypothetical protein
MTNKITQTITSYRVKNNENEQSQEQATIKPSIMHENIKRDDVLNGRTYKIKIPTLEHAVYVTANIMMVDGVHYPYEIFINTKNIEHLQYITAITRLVSAVMRKGGSVRFIAEELMQVFDANGGHWTKKGSNGEKPRFMPSLIAEIGLCLEKHFDYIDLLNNGEKQPVLIETKEPIQEDQEEVKYPDNATICPEKTCRVKSVVLMDGCQVCLSCGSSKCS